MHNCGMTESVKGCGMPALPRGRSSGDDGLRAGVAQASGEETAGCCEVVWVGRGLWGFDVSRCAWNARWLFRQTIGHALIDVDIGE